MVRFGGTDYFYIYNLQSDVVGMIDTNGTLVVEYVYDAWGAPIAKTGKLGKRFTFCTLLVGGPAPNPL